MKNKLAEWMDAAGNKFNSANIAVGIQYWKMVQKSLFPGEDHAKSMIKKMETMHENGRDKEEIEEVSKQLQAYLFGTDIIQQYRDHINSSSSIQKFKGKIKSMMNLKDKSDEEVLKQLKKEEVDPGDLEGDS